jgi:hypothetical protein
MDSCLVERSSSSCHLRTGIKLFNAYRRTPCSTEFLRHNVGSNLTRSWSGGRSRLEVALQIEEVAFEMLMADLCNEEANNE